MVLGEAHVAYSSVSVYPPQRFVTCDAEEPKQRILSAGRVCKI